MVTTMAADDNDAVVAGCVRVQRTTTEATCSERRWRRRAANDARAAVETAAACGDGGSVRRA
jgi:hypothetical protein